MDLSLESAPFPIKSPKQVPNKLLGRLANKPPQLLKSNPSSPYRYSSRCPLSVSLSIRICLRTIQGPPASAYLSRTSEREREQAGLRLQPLPCLCRHPHTHKLPRLTTQPEKGNSVIAYLHAGYSLPRLDFRSIRSSCSKW